MQEMEEEGVACKREVWKEGGRVWLLCSPVCVLRACEWTPA